jgi:hypothetical protein
VPWNEGVAVVIFVALKISGARSYGGVRKRVMGLLQRQQEYTFIIESAGQGAIGIGLVENTQERREERKSRHCWVLEGRRNQTIFEESDDAKLQKVRQCTSS